MDSSSEEGMQRAARRATIDEMVKNDVEFKNWAIKLMSDYHAKKKAPKVEKDLFEDETSSSATDDEPAPPKATKKKQIHRERLKKDADGFWTCSAEGYNKVLGSAKKLLSHIDNHSDKRRHVCPVSLRRFKTYSVMWKHEKIHERRGRVAGKMLSKKIAAKQSSKKFAAQKSSTNSEAEKSSSEASS